MPIRRRPTSDSGHAVAGGVPREDEFRARWPGLWEFLVEAVFEDGSSRQTGTLLLFIEAGVPKVRLCDREQMLVGWFSGRSLEGALDAANEGVETSSGDWRAERVGRTKK